jgi:putative hydrolase of HD superfamily
MLTPTASYHNRGKIKQLGDPMILGLGEIIRYNNRPKIKNENVAEHSFYVVTTVLKIASMYGLDSDIKNKALEFAAVHDIGEAFLGDVPFDTKLNNPELSEVLEKAEVIALEENMPEFADAYRQYLVEEKEETIPYLVTKLADTVSVLQYSNRELELGNRTPQMQSINDGSHLRVATLIDKLEAKLYAE